MSDHFLALFKSCMPNVDYCAFRFVEEISESIDVVRGVAQPLEVVQDRGVMVTIAHAGGLGYAATSDLTQEGLRTAVARAQALAQASAAMMIFDAKQVNWNHSLGEYVSPVAKPLASLPLKERFEIAAQAAATLKIDDRIVNWGASIWTVRTQQLFVTNQGGMTHQSYDFVIPNLNATAFVNGISQTRSSAGQYNGYCQQGGAEILDRAGLLTQGAQVAQDAIALATAPNCPTGAMDVVLMPDQMMLQIHESIGHPLELDRILGDERNFAGTSFVTPDMFGTFQYGSELLNVSYDPTRTQEFASYAFDDDGTPAHKQMLIERGILKRPLGGMLSQQRSGLPGVANSRACSWNRAPIDRMANLNIEPGTSSLSEMIASIEHGVLMRTNCSWSIDDSRNKFQFGCELGQEIRNGKLGGIVRNPNYRGVSRNFWRSLAAVGDESTYEVMGTPYCGKGEPSQVIRVGHASPACLFKGIEVFGGQS